MTQAELDVLKNKYFVRADTTDWPTATVSTDAANLAVGGVKPRIATLNAQLQTDLLLMIDALDPLVV